MEFYNWSLEDRSNELEFLKDELDKLLSDINSKNPYKEELLDLLIRVEEEIEETKNSMPINNDNEYLWNEYQRSVL